MARGVAGGVGATLVSTALAWWYFLPPERTLLKEEPKYFLAAGVFVSMGLAFGAFHWRLRRAKEANEAANRMLRRANEQVSRMYEQTRELDALKTNFFAAVSHELRTPLGLILGPTQRMLDAPETPETSRRDLDVIARNARLLLRHVNDLLDVAKLEADRMKLEYADTDITRLAHFVASHFEGLARERRLAFTIDAPAGMRAQVDPEKVRRILLNLLSNAFKFTPDGGRVRVTLRDAGRVVAIEVADSGPGIAPEHREAVFERFRQLEGGATRRHGGTGLGLAIAREFVALHGGTITVTDAPEGGALFVVGLPRSAPVECEVRGTAATPGSDDEARQAVEELRNPPAAPSLPVGAAEGARVLVVEDNAEMNRFLCESLASRGYRVTAAYDGDEGIRRALEAKPDLILSDVMMPGTGGEQLVAALRARAELDRTPIVLLTAKADDELRVRLLRSGAQDYVTKPCVVEEVCARVGNLLAARRAEEALRASEAKFSGLVSTAADAIVSVDHDQRIVIYNEAAEKTFGWRREEVLGKPLDVLLPERLRAAQAAQVRRFADDPATTRAMESRASIVALHKDGHEFPAEASISKLAVDGRWVFTVVLRDISERRRAEEAQRFLLEVSTVLATTLDYEETLERLANLVVRDLGDCCILDLVGDDGKLHRVKAVVRDPAQRSIADALERVALDRARPHPASHALETKRPVLVSDVTLAYLRSIAQSEEHARVLGELAPRSLMAFPLVAHRELQGVLGVLSTRAGRRYDAADLRLGEELAGRAAYAVESARHYRAAQRAVAARDDVLGVVAHDLRNPLHAIVLHSQLLSREQLPDRRAPVEAIRRATARMDRLIQDLLDVTRLEAGRLSIAPAPVAAGQLVSDAVEAQRPIGAAAALDLRLDVERDLPEVWADRDRLLQVFENLLGNAFKFTAAGGSVTAGAARRGEDVLFRVTDTGGGIPPEDQAHLFDRFWQAQKTGRRGAGLGLPIVKGLVEAHGGRIWVESAVGRGSTFFFTIPTAAAVRARQASPAACDA